MRAFADETLGYAAEALDARQRLVRGARKQITRSDGSAQQAGWRSTVAVPRLRMLDARIADALGDPRRARDALLAGRSPRRARREAAWLELLGAHWRSASGAMPPSSSWLLSARSSRD